MPEMTPTPDQALKFLSSITAGIQANRETHSQIALSLKILEQALAQVEAPVFRGDRT